MMINIIDFAVRPVNTVSFFEFISFMCLNKNYILVFREERQEDNP